MFIISLFHHECSGVVTSYIKAVAVKGVKLHRKLKGDSVRHGPLHHKYVNKITSQLKQETRDIIGQE